MCLLRERSGSCTCVISKLHILTSLHACSILSYSKSTLVALYIPKDSKERHPLHVYIYKPELTRSPTYPAKHHICNMYRKGACIGYRTKPPPPKKQKGATSLIYRQNLDQKQECKCRVLVIYLYTRIISIPFFQHFPSIIGVLLFCCFLRTRKQALPSQQQSPQPHS
jgi:hypothetical protein